MAQEERKSDLGKIAWGIEDRSADIPAQSVAGALAQLRMAGAHYRLMEYYDGKWTGDKYAQLTWQAWDGLERLIGTAAAEDPVLALKREWETRWQRYESEADCSDEVMNPLHDALCETEYEIFQTPATTLAGIAFKLVLWARQHVGHDAAGTGWSRDPVTDYPPDLDHLPVVSALHDLECMARTTTGADTPPAEDD